jgi:hypothetical protein
MPRVSGLATSPTTDGATAARFDVIGASLGVMDRPLGGGQLLSSTVGRRVPETCAMIYRTNF